MALIVYMIDNGNGVLTRAVEQFVGECVGSGSRMGR
jgi:hypothetical protein